MHGRADQSACHGKLMVSAEIFFTGFELLTFVVKGTASRKSRVHVYLRRVKE